MLALLPGGCAVDVTSLIPFTDTTDTTVASDTTGASDRIQPASQVAAVENASHTAASPVMTGSISGRATAAAPPPPPAARRYPEVNAVPAPPRRVAATDETPRRRQTARTQDVVAAVPQPAAPAMLHVPQTHAPSISRPHADAARPMADRMTTSAPAPRTVVEPVPVAEQMPVAEPMTVAEPLPHVPTVTAAARAPLPQPQPSRAATATHRVVRGDTLYGIARRHGLAMVDLARANTLAPPYVIHPGQQLTIPRVSTAAVDGMAADPVQTGTIVDAPATGPRRLTGARLQRSQKPSAEAAAAEAYSDVVRNSKMMPGQTLFSF